MRILSSGLNVVCWSENKSGKRSFDSSVEGRVRECCVVEAGWSSSGSVHVTGMT
jgi:hypothetical protein